MIQNFWNNTVTGLKIACDVEVLGNMFIALKRAGT